MTEIIQANYEQLQEIATRFAEQADIQQQLAQMLVQRSEDLHRAGWQGQGANAFRNEMENSILPALQRLISALEEGDKTVQQIILIFQAAEEEASGSWDAGEDFPISSGGEEGGLSFPGQLKGITGILDLINIIRKSKGSDFLLDLGPLGPILGIIADSWGNPDEDWLQSIGSAAIENVGIAGLARLYLPIGIVMASSDILQMAGEWSEVANDWFIDQLGLSPEMSADLAATSDRFYDNIDRLDLGNITEPLADALYHQFVTPIIDVGGDVWQDPSLENILRFGAVLTNRDVGFLFSPEAAKGMVESGQEIGMGLLNLGYGLADLPDSMVDMGLAQGAGVVVAVSDRLPLPDSWQETIGDGAEWFVNKVEEGLIPGMNIPGVMLF